MRRRNLIALFAGAALVGRPCRGRARAARSRRAAGPAGHRLSQPRLCGGRSIAAEWALGRIEAAGFYRRPECCDRVPLRRGEQPACAVSRSRADRASGGGDGRVRVARGRAGEEGDRMRPDRLCPRLRPGANRPRRQLQPAGRQRDRSSHVRGRGNFEAPGIAARGPPAARSGRLSRPLSEDPSGTGGTPPGGSGRPTTTHPGSARRDEDEIEKAFATMAERQVRGLLGASQYFR